MPVLHVNGSVPGNFMAPLHGVRAHLPVGVSSKRTLLRFARHQVNGLGALLGEISH